MDMDDDGLRVVFWDKEVSPEMTTIGIWQFKWKNPEDDLLGFLSASIHLAATTRYGINSLEKNLEYVLRCHKPRISQSEMDELTSHLRAIPRAGKAKAP